MSGALDKARVKSGGSVDTGSQLPPTASPNTQGELDRGGLGTCCPPSDGGHCNCAAPMSADGHVVKPTQPFGELSPVDEEALDPNPLAVPHAESVLTGDGKQWASGQSVNPAQCMPFAAPESGVGCSSAWGPSPKAFWTPWPNTHEIASALLRARLSSGSHDGLVATPDEFGLPSRGMQAPQSFEQVMQATPLDHLASGVPFAGAGAGGLPLDNGYRPWLGFIICWPTALRWRVLPPSDVDAHGQTGDLQLVEADVLKDATPKKILEPATIADLVTTPSSVGSTPPLAGGLEMLVGQTSNKGFLFFNLASVEAGPEDGCLWRQVIEKFEVNIVTTSNVPLSRSLAKDKARPTVPNPRGNHGPNGEEQDWGPYNTSMREHVDYHSWRRATGVKSADYFIQFLMQATVPLDVAFGSNAVVCRRWYYRWTMKNLGPGNLVIMVGPLMKGQANCKPKK